MEIVGVPLITALTLGLVRLLKGAVKSSKNYEKINAFFPIIAAVTGVILGIIAFYAAPQMMIAGNVLSAMLVGGTSGIAATGCHQCFKKLVKPNGEGNGGDNGGQRGDESESEAENAAKKIDKAIDLANKLKGKD